MSATVYVVLAQGESNQWRELGRHKATSARQAINACLLARDGTVEAPAFVAVPERSFKLEYPEVQQVQRVVFGATQAQADEQVEPRRGQA